MLGKKIVSFYKRAITLLHWEWFSKLTSAPIPFLILTV